MPHFAARPILRGGELIIHIHHALRGDGAGLLARRSEAGKQHVASK